jgi:hypothetical protein
MKVQWRIFSTDVNADFTVTQPNDLHRSALKHSAIAAHNKGEMGNNCASMDES